jgi:perosamine synthetase
MSGNGFIPYGRQEIAEEDIAAVTEALRSAWLTTGPTVGAFEEAFAAFCSGPAGGLHGVAVNSGTAALHAAMRALRVGPGDEVIVPALTFAASGNCALYEGATPVIADVEPDTLLIDPQSVEARLTPRTKAIVGVDYGGQPADWDRLRAIAGRHGLKLIADACHSPGATYHGRPVGTLADISCFSFHPVKHLTTCEGGMCVTADASLASHMRRFRNHGIDSDARTRETKGAFGYDLVELGYNYRLPDVQSALGIAQLKRLPDWVKRRQMIAREYDRAFARLAHVRPLVTRAGRTNAHHLYVVRLELERLQIDRARAFAHLRAKGIGANVHYPPLHLMQLYRERLGTGPGLCPNAEAAHARILTLPMFQAMTAADVARVLEAVGEIAGLSRA